MFTHFIELCSWFIIYRFVLTFQCFPNCLSLSVTVLPLWVTPLNMFYNWYPCDDKLQHTANVQIFPALKIYFAICPLPIDLFMIRFNAGLEKRQILMSPIISFFSSNHHMYEHYPNIMSRYLRVFIKHERTQNSSFTMQNSLANVW